MALIDGMKVNLRGMEFTVPPLTLWALRRLTEDGTMGKIESVGTKLTVGDIDAIAAVAQAAMVENYPEITVEEIQRKLDLGNVHGFTAAIMAASGMQRAVPGEARGPKT